MLTIAIIINLQVPEFRTVTLAIKAKIRTKYDKNLGWTLANLQAAGAACAPPANADIDSNFF